MLSLAALLLASQAASSGERDMLEAFKTACARTGDLEAMKADAAGAGWTAMTDDEEPRIARLVRIGRDAVADGKLSGASFRHKLGGRELFLIVSRYEDASGFWGVGCRLYDFAATSPLDPALLEGWMGKPPTGVEAPAAGLSRRLWEPGWRNGITVEASHVPAGHPLGQSFGLQGNILVAQAIGGF